MKKIVMLLCSVIIIQGLAHADIVTDQDNNLEKYWKYRDRLRKHFVVVSPNVEEPGVNIPAADIYKNTGVVDWGDGNTNMSHYLSLLASELWLLKKNNQDYTLTLTELYYAMSALERLDLYSEQYWRDELSLGGTSSVNDINGFHLRDDVNNDFWTAHSSKWTSPSYYPMTNFSSRFDNNGTNSGLGDLPLEEMSQDCIMHNLEGLALVSKLVGTESVQGIPIYYNSNPSITKEYLEDNEILLSGGNVVDFTAWANDIIRRYITYMQSSSYSVEYMGVPVGTTNWILKNPIRNELVQEGSGSDGNLHAFFNNGLVQAGIKLTGNNYRQYPGLEGDKLFNDLFQKHAIHATTYPTYGLLATMFYETELDLSFEWNEELEEWEASTWVYILNMTEDYLLRSLGATSNIAPNSSESLIQHQFDPNYYPYEHLLLLNVALYEADHYGYLGLRSYNYHQVEDFINGLLVTAPICGPASDDHDDWSITSRCVWPEKLNTVSGHVEYAGMDYMMLHNLLYVAVRKEDFMVIDPITDNLANQTINLYRGILEASNVVINGNVTYKAATAVKLKPGFHSSGSGTFSFLAKTENRNTDYTGSKYKVLNETFTFCNTLDEDPPEEGRPSLANGETTTDIEKEASTHNNYVELSPNPTSGKFRIMHNLGEAIKYEVVDARGVIIKSGEMPIAGTLDITGQTPGLYYIRIYTSKEAFTKRIVLVY